MTDIASSKASVLGYFEEFENAPVESLAGVIARHGGDDLQFRGVHPFNEIQGAAEIAASVWQPLREAFPFMQRR